MYKEATEKELSRKQREKKETGAQPVVLYSKFRTKNHYYIYDTQSNEILQVSPVTYDIIDEYLKNGGKKGELPVLYNYKKADIAKAVDDIEEGKQNGYLQSTDIKKMNFYENNDILMDEVKHKIKSLGLENTTRCNFRCKYCAFSGHYPEKRSHGSQDMDWDTARSAIDILMRHSSKVERRKNIGFWGGEPMLNMSLIRKVVDYVEKNYPGEDMFYNFTTNGSLFNDENIEFFIKHKFSIQVSLNGPRHIHDKYRVGINGKGTFDNIVSGLRRIREIDSAYYDENINFSCTLTPGTDHEEVISFFSKNELFKNKEYFAITGVNPQETTFFEEYGYLSQEEMERILKLYWRAAINGTLEKEKFIENYFQSAMMRFFKRCRSRLGDRVQPNGCCIPMLKKMHVDVNGNIHLCERMPGYNPLGNVNTKGIDYDAIVRLANEYTSNSLEDCRKCWAVRFCMACFKDFLKNNKWYDDDRKEWCERIRGKILNDLISYSFVLEKNPRAYDYMHNFKESN